MGELIPALLTAIIAMVGLAGNTVVLWLLGFRMQRTAFSVYILNLAGADFLFLCCQITASLYILMDYFPSIPYSIVRYFVPVFISAYIARSSLALVTRLLCGSQRVQPTRLYVTVLLTVLVFLLCGLPWGIHWFLKYWIKSIFYGFTNHFLLVAVVLTCVNSCANPIIYFFVGSFRQRWRKGRQTLKLVLQRALQDTPEGDEHGRCPPQETLEM
nr:PREDICTED: mas-related G-protein coupled receptor member B4-like [Rhinolophus sinicus]